MDDGNNKNNENEEVHEIEEQKNQERIDAEWKRLEVKYTIGTVLCIGLFYFVVLLNMFLMRNLFGLPTYVYNVISIINLGGIPMLIIGTLMFGSSMKKAGFRKLFYVLFALVYIPLIVGVVGLFLLFGTCMLGGIR